MTGQREKGSKVVKAVTEAGSDREMMVMESVAKPRALINLSPPIQAWAFSILR